MTGNVARRGARRLVDVPADVLLSLHAGGASANHIEQMAIDMAELVRTLIPEASLGEHPIDSPKFLTRMRAGAAIAWESLGTDLFTAASDWESDTARGWAAFAVPNTRLCAEEQLDIARQFAADPHFAVREWAWLGVRPTVSQNLTSSIEHLAEWTKSSDPNVRRFTVETIRARGVWSAHISELKTNPDLGLPVLDEVVTDRHRYVQTSVANWLNDVRKSRPRWVHEHLIAWNEQHGSEPMRFVTRRGTRGRPLLPDSSGA